MKLIKIKELDKELLQSEIERLNNQSITIIAILVSIIITTITATNLKHVNMVFIIYISLTITSFIWHSILIKKEEMKLIKIINEMKDIYKKLK